MEFCDSGKAGLNMGVYLNCGNKAFADILNSEYIDKTGLVEIINSKINTYNRMTCVSRPRRFGKSFAAYMLAAYYDKSCDSRSLFEGLNISKCESFEKYLNKFDVIYIDMTRVISVVGEIKNILKEMQGFIIEELREAYPGCIREGESSLADALIAVTNKYNTQFFVIIDEWDALFREAKNDEKLQKDYVIFLRGMFKGGVNTSKTIAGAYMTGILPIKKYGTESALTDFREYTMVAPMKLAEYIGFTEDEVKGLCEKNNLDFEEMERWYDGYSFNRIKHIYSPNSVMNAVNNEEFRNYWTGTESYESLKNYISMNMDGLKDDIIEMLGGKRGIVDPLNFQNDMISFKSKDDVLTLLVHLGYLAYDEKSSEVYIPNLEVSDSFRLAVQNTGWEEVSNALRDSERLLRATINGDSDMVAAALENIHSSSSSILQYNNENSLSCALTIAYYTAKRDYIIIREFPTGKGFADLAFIPRKNTDRPAMIIELKYDKSADSAIKQIKERRYTGELSQYTGEILLVGISYDKENKKHECVIESSIQ